MGALGGGGSHGWNLSVSPPKPVEQDGGKTPEKPPTPFAFPPPPPTRLTGVLLTPTLLIGGNPNSVTG